MVLLFAAATVTHLGGLQHLALQFHVWIVRSLRFWPLGSHAGFCFSSMPEVMLGSLLPCPVHKTTIQGSCVFQRRTNPMSWGNATLQYKCYCINQLSWISALWDPALCLCSIGKFPMMWVSGGCKQPSGSLHCQDKGSKNPIELGCAWSVLQS